MLSFLINLEDEIKTPRFFSKKNIFSCYGPTEKKQLATGLASWKRDNPDTKPIVSEVTKYVAPTIPSRTSSAVSQKLGQILGKKTKTKRKIYVDDENNDENGEEDEVEEDLEDDAFAKTSRITSSAKPNQNDLFLNNLVVNLKKEQKIFFFFSPSFFID